MRLKFSILVSLDRSFVCPSSDWITKYERAKILGVRTEQLNNNAVANVDVPKHITNVRKIAELEFYQKKIPFMIRRRLPDGTYEHWRLSDFKNL